MGDIVARWALLLGGAVFVLLPHEHFAARGLDAALVGGWATDRSACERTSLPKGCNAMLELDGDGRFRVMNGRGHVTERGTWKVIRPGVMKWSPGSQRAVRVQYVLKGDVLRFASDGPLRAIPWRRLGMA